MSVWATAASIPTARNQHTATLLPTGKVLVAGGQSSGSSITSAVVYDPALMGWASTTPLNTARCGHTATLLPNGQVLAVGGYGTTYLRSVELYDLATGAWTPASSTIYARYQHTATLLPNGKVLAAGGFAGGPSRTAEIYDPASATWTLIFPMSIAREGPTATLLPNGKVLLAGGYSGAYEASAELYDPATGAWTATGSLATGRAGHTATLLPSGKVLAMGGQCSGSPGIAATAELYDPATGLWTVTGAPSTARRSHRATLLPNGKVLVAGGYYDVSVGLQAELYDPVRGTWTLSGGMVNCWNNSLVLLPNGKVLLAGGHYYDHGAYGDSAFAQVFDPGLGFSPSWQPQVAGLTSPLSLGGSLAVSGSGFRGVSEGSGGGSQDSAADYPLVQLRNLDSERSVFLLSTNWQTNSFTSAAVWGFPPGYALATVFVNGTPSTGSVLNVSVPVPSTTTLISARTLTNGAFQFTCTNSVGALLGVLATTNPALALSNWTALGGVTEAAPGQFYFTDPPATNTPRRFYRVCLP